MAHAHTLQRLDCRRKSVFLFGMTAAQPWYRDRIIKESQAAGLNVVVAKLTSDHSENVLRAIHRESEASPEAQSCTEVLPHKISAISSEMRSDIRRQYGDDWCALPLSDYVTEYAAAMSADLSEACYPVRSAQVVKRKHELRALWNRLAASSPCLCPVEYCYLELPKHSEESISRPSKSFNSLPEEMLLIVKPDELSSSIEIHCAASKTEALAVAHEVCAQLLSTWHEVGQSIGTEVLPRVLIETAIDRSCHLHSGAEFSIEFLSFGEHHYPIGVTQKWTGPNFMEIGHLFPAESLPVQLKFMVENAVVSLLQELKVRYAVSHWEFIVTNDERIALVEGHLRPAGGRIMELVEHSTGHSPTAALCMAMADGTQSFLFHSGSSCGLFWLVPQTPLTRVTEVIYNVIAAVPAIKDVYINEEGIKATPNWSHASDWTTRFVHVLTTGSNLAEITGYCRRVANEIVLSGERDGVPATTRLKLAIDP
jgi:hypothetical protein